MERLNDLKSIIVFYILAFAFSWTGWLPIILNSQKFFSAPAIYIKAFLILPAISLVLAAIIARRAVYTKENRENLFTRFFNYRVKLTWYLAAVFVPLTILLLTKIFESFLSSSNELSLPAGSLLDVLTILLISLAANPCEEIGWRGFALPRLQNMYNSFVASIIIGVLSGLWHIPFFYWSESPMAAYPFLPWLVGTICVSFVATWLFNSTNRSLVVVSIFHILLNTFSVLIGISSFYVYACVSAMFVIFLLVFFTNQFFLIERIKH